MKQGDFRRLLVFALICAAAAASLTSCGELPSNQNANSSAAVNRNANAAISQRDLPSAAASPSSSVMPPEEFIPPPAATSTPEASAPPDTITAVTPSATLTPETPASKIVPPSDDYSVVSVEKLIIPVEGIKREQLQDTFKDTRSEGRVHDAIDIMAPGGTPVLAAADGEIARFFDSVKGGITIYQFSRDKKLIYYYAHLQRRADGVQPGQFVKQGTVIGYVGDTGNSGAGNFHLHFAVWAIEDPKRYWNGTNINPYPLLQR